MEIWLLRFSFSPSIHFHFCLSYFSFTFPLSIFHSLPSLNFDFPLLPFPCILCLPKKAHWLHTLLESMKYLSLSQLSESRAVHCLKCILWDRCQGAYQCWGNHQRIRYHVHALYVNRSASSSSRYLQNEIPHSAVKYLYWVWRDRETEMSFTSCS